MRNRWRNSAVQVFLICLAFIGECHAETLPLSQWLDTISRPGFNIIYSSALVPGYYNVTVDDEQTTFDEVRSVLHKFDLDLKPAGTGSWVVIRRRVEESPHEPLPPVEDVDVPFKPLEEIVVTSSRYRLLIDRSASLATMEHDEIARRPVIANDAIRAINQLPGNATVGISVKPRVRGGGQDETLILFNGVRLYEPFHLSAFNNLFGSIDNRVIESLDFYSGGFPARYGDRLSGVMSITSRSPDQLAPVKELGLGLYNFSYLQAGSTRNGDYMVDVRRSTLELLNRISETDLGKPSFSDVYARYDHYLDGGSLLSTNLFWYGDKVSLNNSSRSERATTIDGNAYLWWALESGSGSNYRDTRFGVTLINKSREGTVFKPSISTGFLKEDRELRVYSLGQDFGKLISPSLLLEAGFDLRRLEAEYESRQAFTVHDTFSPISNLSRPASREADIELTGWQGALYTNIKWTVGEHLTVNTGLRLDSQDYIRDSWTRQLSPRLGLLYQFDTGTALRVAWGKFTQAQGLHELPLSDGTEQFHAAEKTIHQIVSLSQPLGPVNLRLEFYRKRGIDDAVYFENLTNPLTLVPELQFDRIIVDPDQYEARGVELSLSGNHGNTFWWLNYSRSSTADHVDRREVERSWDQTHGANAGIGFDIGSWQLSLACAYHTGWPTTPLSLNETGTLVAGARNSIRFEHYTSMDIKLSHEWPKARLRLEAGVTNLLGRENQTGIEYAVENGELVASKKFALGIAPFLDLYWRLP